MYRIHYGVLTTGQLSGELPAASASFGDELRSTGTLHAQVAVGQCAGPKGDKPGHLWNATRGAYTLWAAEWYDNNGGRQIVAGGPLFARMGDSDSGITYDGYNLFALMGHRKVIDQAWTDTQISTNSLTFSALDLGSIIRGIVQKVTATAPAALPLVLEAPRTGSNTRTYNGYDLVWAADKISEIGNVESGTGGLGGPDWLFMPRFKAGDFTHIEWTLTTGTAAQPWITQTGSVVVLDAGAVNQQNVGKISVSEDASKIATTAFAAGNGLQNAKVIATATDATLTNAGYPRMDGESSNNSVDRTLVSSYAQGTLTRAKRATDSTTVEVRASWWWANGGGVGTTVQLLDPTNAVFGPINLTSRVMKWDVSALDSEWVTLTLADALNEV